MLKIGIVGSRRRNTSEDKEIVHNVFKHVSKIDVNVFSKSADCIIVSGGCKKGADCIAEELARLYGITIIIHHANWSLYGKKAGHIRNEQIAKDSDILIACVSLDRTGGTESTINKYRNMGKTELYIC